MTYRTRISGTYRYRHNHALEAALDAFAAHSRAHDLILSLGEDILRQGLRLHVRIDNSFPASDLEHIYDAVVLLSDFADEGDCAAWYEDERDHTAPSLRASYVRSRRQILPPRHSRWDLWHAVESGDDWLAAALQARGVPPLTEPPRRVWSDPSPPSATPASLAEAVAAGDLHAAHVLLGRGEPATEALLAQAIAAEAAGIAVLLVHALGGLPEPAGGTPRSVFRDQLRAFWDMTAPERLAVIHDIRAISWAVTAPEDEECRATGVERLQELMAAWGDHEAHRTVRAWVWTQAAGGHLRRLRAHLPGLPPAARRALLGAMSLRGHLPLPPVDVELLLDAPRRGERHRDAAVPRSTAERR